MTKTNRKKELQNMGRRRGFNKSFPVLFENGMREIFQPFFIASKGRKKNTA
jgi:hypothetical protein